MSLPFPPFQPSHIPFPLYFKFMTSFFQLLLQACLHLHNTNIDIRMYIYTYIQYTHIYVCMYKCLNVACSVYITLIVCLFSGLTIWHWQPACVLFPGEGPSRTPSFFQLPLVLCVGWEPWGLLPVQSGMSICVIHVQLAFGWSWWWDFVGVASDITVS